MTNDILEKLKTIQAINILIAGLMNSTHGVSVEQEESINIMLEYINELIHSITVELIPDI